MFTNFNEDVYRTGTNVVYVFFFFSQMNIVQYNMVQHKRKQRTNKKKRQKMNKAKETRNINNKKI